MIVLLSILLIIHFLWNPHIDNSPLILLLQYWNLEFDTLMRGLHFNHIIVHVVINISWLYRYLGLILWYFSVCGLHFNHYTDTLKCCNPKKLILVDALVLLCATSVYSDSKPIPNDTCHILTRTWTTIDGYLIHSLTNVIAAKLLNRKIEE